MNFVRSMRSPSRRNELADIGAPIAQPPNPRPTSVATAGTILPLSGRGQAIAIVPEPHSTSSADRTIALLRDACAADLDEAIACGEAADIPALVRAVAEFALIARGAIRPGSRSAQRAFRVGRLCLARRLMAQNLSQAALSPAMIAELLGVSVRYVHMLFETTGMSFSHTVAEMRITASRRLLSETSKPITDIAHVCGFGSLATFYRVFNASEGLTPGEFRDRSAREALAGTAAPDAGATAYLTQK